MKLGWETPHGWTADGALLVASIDGGRIRTMDTFKGVISGGGIYALVGFDADALLDAADTTRRSTDCSAAP